MQGVQADQMATILQNGDYSIFGIASQTNDLYNVIFSNKLHWIPANK